MTQGGDTADPPPRQETRRDTRTSGLQNTDHNSLQRGHIPQLQRSTGFSPPTREQARNKDVWLQSNYPLKEITINSELPNYRGQANLGNH